MKYEPLMHTQYENLPAFICYPNKLMHGNSDLFFFFFIKCFFIEYYIILFSILLFYAILIHEVTIKVQQALSVQEGKTLRN